MTAICTDHGSHYHRKWSRISVKAKNRLARLKRRIKAYEETVKQYKNDRGLRKPGSLKK